MPVPDPLWRAYGMEVTGPPSVYDMVKPPEVRCPLTCSDYTTAHRGKLPVLQSRFLWAC